jgi:hypothetical protein
MRSISVLRPLVLAALAGAAPLAAQEGGGQQPSGRPGQQGTGPGQVPPRGPETWPQTAKGQQHQEMIRRMERLVEQVRETNRWMAQHQSAQGFRTMGREMEQADEPIREMLREVDRLHQDPMVSRDRDRLRETDRLRERLHEMERQMEQAHEALRKAVGHV